MKQKLSIFKLFVVAMLFVATIGAWSVFVQSGKTAAATSLAACTPTGTTYGTDSFAATNNPANPIVIPSNGTYHIWVRVEVPAVSSGSPLLLNMDNATGNNCYAVSGSSITAVNTWTWVEATAGLALPTFTQGNHTLLVTGTQSGASLDLIDVLPNIAGCTPTTLSQCSTTANTPPTASVTAPTSGQTVSGTVNLAATAAATTSGATITSVQFKDGTTNIGSADTTAPYTASWNTAGLSGSQTITVVATDTNGLQTTSSGITVTVSNAAVCTTGTLSAPTGLTKGSVTYTSIGLSWTAPTPTPGCSITGYKVFRDGSQVGAPTTASYPDTGLTAGSTHTYTVEAVDNGSNTSGQSAAINASTTADNMAPSAPSGLTATAASAGQVNLAWTGNGDLPNPGGVGVAGYNVYRNNSNTPLNGSTLVTGTSYNDTTVSASTAYTYQVEAVDKVGNVSAPTNIASVTTPAPTCSGTPTQPGTPTAGATSINSVSFSWAKSTASAGCTLNGYHIYQVNGSIYTLVTTVANGTGATISTSISGLTPNTSYTYAVEAFDTSGHISDKTQAATHITIATAADTTAPTAPASLTAAAASSNQVNLTWLAGSDNVGVTSYKIYRSDKTTAITTVTASAATSYSFTDSTASPSTTYTYQVSALDAAGHESTKTTSNSVTTPAATGTAPSAPRSPGTQGIVGPQSVGLTWSAPATGTVTGYHVYINGVLDTYSNGTVTDTFTATGGMLNCLAPSVGYTIAVKAFNSAGEGPAVTIPVTTQSGGLAGDFDCNGHVDGFDLNALATDWLKTSMQPFLGDANGDATVNGFDLNALATNWGKSS